MRERPTGANLLATARAEFEARLLPSLQGADRHTARMILRAMDLALREMEQGAVADEAERQGLQELFISPSGEAAAAASPEAVLGQMNRDLVDLIRSGQADPGSPLHGPVLEHLRAVAKGRLAISQPRLLPARAG